MEATLGPKHIEVAEILNSIGLVLKKRGDYDEAQTLYERAIKIIRDTFGPNQEHYKLGICYNNLADLDRERSNYDDALRIYRRALTIIEKTLGSEHSEAAEILHNIGQVQLQLGQLEKKKNLSILSHFQAMINKRLLILIEHLLLSNRSSPINIINMEFFLTVLVLFT